VTFSIIQVGSPWIAVKESNETLPDHIYRLFERNKDYRVNIIGNEEKTKFLTNAYTVANDPDIDIKPEVRSAVNDAFAIYEDFLLKTESETTRLASNSSDMKRSFRDDAFVELEALIKQDKSGVVKELFRHSLKGLMNAKSRDARNTISGK
jgi:hypothetical protein